MAYLQIIPSLSGEIMPRWIKIRENEYLVWEDGVITARRPVNRPEEEEAIFSHIDYF